MNLCLYFSVKFEQGLVKKEEIQKMSCNVMTNADDPKEYMLMLNDGENEYKYKGRKIEEESQLCQRFFIIRNKRTNKVS